MSDRDVIVRAESLGKTYRLYAKPHYRFLDMFGLLRKAGVYTEHAALRGVDLEIRRGEKVAFIGRNGAGKSTLLKLITGVIQPSVGSLHVSQGAHALLQIGSGFHQDFTGRQNALAYLAHLGVSGKNAEQRLVEIVDFAELESYIDQPIKTYSTGMVARLMFATSTVIEPELLVLDEILGVGDAYFSQKSFARIREMCDANGTTVLLVSHDIYSAAKLCDRMIWIDQGQLIFDGPSIEAIKAYEVSIREQEEQRLRSKKILQTAAASQSLAMVEFAAGEALEAPIEFLEISVHTSDGYEINIPITEENAFSSEQDARLIHEESNWGDVVESPEGACRQMRNFGTPFNKVAFALRVPSSLNSLSHPPLLKCRLRSSAHAELHVTWFDEQRKPCWVGGLILNSHENAVRHSLGLEPLNVGNAIAKHRPIGTQRVSLENARFVNEAGDEMFFLRHGFPVRLLMNYYINDPEFDEKPQVTVSIHRDGAVDVCRYIYRNVQLDMGRRKGVVEFALERMPLSNGRYTVSVMCVRQGYFDEFQTQYFTINAGVYSCHARTLEFEVIDGDQLSSGTVFVGEAQWAVK